MLPSAARGRGVFLDGVSLDSVARSACSAEASRRGKQRRTLLLNSERLFDNRFLIELNTH